LLWFYPQVADKSVCLALFVNHLDIVKHNSVWACHLIKLYSLTLYMHRSVLDYLSYNIYRWPLCLNFPVMPPQLRSGSGYPSMHNYWEWHIALHDWCLIIKNVVISPIHLFKLKHSASAVQGSPSSNLGATTSQPG